MRLNQKLSNYGFGRCFTNPSHRTLPADIPDKTARVVSRPWRKNLGGECGAVLDLTIIASIFILVCLPAAIFVSQTITTEIENDARLAAAIRSEHTSYNLPLLTLATTGFIQPSPQNNIVATMANLAARLTQYLDPQQQLNLYFVQSTPPVNGAGNCGEIPNPQTLFSCDTSAQVPCIQDAPLTNTPAGCNNIFIARFGQLARANDQLCRPEYAVLVHDVGADPTGSRCRILFPTALWTAQTLAQTGVVGP